MCKCVQQVVPVERHLRHLHSWKQELICPHDTNCPGLEIKRDVDIQCSVHCSSGIPKGPGSWMERLRAAEFRLRRKNRKGLRRRQPGYQRSEEWMANGKKKQPSQIYIGYHMALITTVGAAYALQNCAATTRSYQPQLWDIKGQFTL